MPSFRRLKLATGANGRQLWRAEFFDAARDCWTSPSLFSRSDPRARDPEIADAELVPAWERVRNGKVPTPRQAHLRAAELARELAARQHVVGKLRTLLEGELNSGGKRGKRSPSTEKEVARALNRFCDFMEGHFPRVDTRDVTAAHIDRYLTHLKDAVSYATVMRQRAYLHRTFARLVELGALELNPVSRIKMVGPTRLEVKQRTRTYVLTRAQCAELLSAARAPFDVEFLKTSKGKTKTITEAFNPPRFLHPFLLMSLRTGARVGELLPVGRKLLDGGKLRAKGLTWGDVDFGRHVVFVTGKTGPRALPLDRETERALLELKDWASRAKITPTHVFLNDDYTPVTDPRKVFWAACARAKISRHVRLHDLRHTCLTQLAEDGMAPALLQAVAGHTTITMTERYLSVAEDAVIAAFRKLRS